jgi:hypothetical protein
VDGKIRAGVLKMEILFALLSIIYGYAIVWSLDIARFDIAIECLVLWGLTAKLYSRPK